jgi:hypothetical protein
VLATVCTPACNICTAPPVMPPTTAATPGTFIPHPSNNVYRAHTCDVLTNCSTRTRRGPDRNSRRQLSARLRITGLAADRTQRTARDQERRSMRRPRPYQCPGHVSNVLAGPRLQRAGTPQQRAARWRRWDEHHVAGSGEGAPGEESGHGVAPGEPDRQRRHLNTIVPCLACASSSTYGVSTPNSASQPRRRRVPGAADR